MSYMIEEDTEHSFTLNKLFWITSERDYDLDSLIKVSENEAKRNAEEPLQLKEGCSYEYEILDSGIDLNSVRLETDAGINLSIVHPSKKHPNTGRITPGIYVGRLPLKIVSIKDKKNPLFTFAVEVRSTKANYRSEYRKMLQDITSECVDLVMQHSSVVTQRFSINYGTNSESLYQRFAFVQSMVGSDDFESTVQKILTAPITSWQTKTEELDTRRIKKIGSAQLRQFASGKNRLLVPKENRLSNTLCSIPQRLRSTIKTDTVDNPENRFIKYVLTEFARFSGYICQKIEENPTKPKPHIYDEAKNLQEKLSEYLNRSMFKSVSQINSLPLNNPVLQRKEGYREVFRVWLMYDLAAKLTWDGLDTETYNAGKRNVATLYEYWLFFKLLRLVEDLFHINPTETKDLIDTTKNKLGLQLKEGKALSIQGTYTHKNRKLKIKYCFNRTFSYADYPKGGSWTQKMRPDYTLSFWPDEFKEKEAEEQELIIHIHFDAKYKIDNLKYLVDETKSEQNSNQDDDAESVEALDIEKELEKSGTYKRGDLLKMHAYKDAIRRTAGAYILYPGSKSVKQKGFHELIPGLGAFAVSPSSSDDGMQTIRQFIIEVVNNYANRTTQREVHSFYTYKTMKNATESAIQETYPEMAIGEDEKTQRSKPLQEIQVLIGYIQDKQKNWVLENGMYNIRIDKEITPEMTGANYLLLYDGQNEDKSLKFWQNGLFHIKNNPILQSKEWMLNKKYPSPSMPDYFVYPIEHSISEWSTAKIKAVYLQDIEMLYRPFTRSLPQILL